VFGKIKIMYCNFNQKKYMVRVLQPSTMPHHEGKAKEESLTSLRKRARAFNKTATEKFTKNKKDLKDQIKVQVNELRTYQKKEMKDFVAGKAGVTKTLQQFCRGNATKINMKQNENGLRHDLDLIKKRNADAAR
jgi:hypothetical protein